MKNLLPLLALLLTTAACATGSAPGGREAPSGLGISALSRKSSAWSLAWSDEFDGPAGAAPDASKWTYDLGGDGFGNQELETYCAPGSAAAPCDPAHPNAVMDGRGHLVISAVKNADGKWTSARLKTFGLKDFQYGRVEARMRLPYGAGLWPAFWLLGTDIPTVGWPSCGEIDIMENVPGDVPGGLGADTIKSTLHGPGYSGVNGYGRTVKFPGGGRVDDEYHVYGAIWSPGKIEFYLDDPSNVFFVASRAGIPAGTKWVFDHPFFVIMNLAVGGSWPKDPKPETPNPANMLVDYVRVYRRAP
jgi:beta-glucanase (GH16 family)